MRALSVLAVALLVCAATVGAAGGLDTPSPRDPVPALDGRPVAQSDAPSTPPQIHVLDVPPESVVRSSVAEHYVDLGPAVGLSTNATTERLRTLAVVERVTAAETRAERSARIRTALRDLEARIDALDRRQNDAIAAHNRGRLSERALLVELVRINIVAVELDDRRLRLGELIEEYPTVDVNRGRLAALGHRLSAFTGPVRAHAHAVMQGEASPHRFYMATGDRSVTLSTVVEGAYLREVYRDDIRDGGSGQLELEVALDIVAATYPVIWNTTREQTQVFGGGETYPVRVVHGRGDLTAFVDSAATEVYAEHQRRPLETVVTAGRAGRTDGDLRLTVNHTYPGGPVEVRAADASGDPVDVAVSLRSGSTDPQRVGTTGDDGTLWTVSPRARYTVSVEHRGRNVSVDVSPSSPPLADDGTETPTPTPTPTGTATA
jgi:hypothetical protein